SDMKAAEATMALADAIAAANGAMDEAIDTTDSWATQITDALLPSWLPFDEAVSDTMQSISGGGIAAQQADAREAAAGAARQYHEAKAAGQDTTDLARQLSEAQKDQFELEGKKQKVIETTQKQFASVLDMQERQAKLTGEQFDRQEALNVLIEGADQKLAR